MCKSTPKHIHGAWTKKTAVLSLYWVENCQTHYFWDIYYLFFLIGIPTEATTLSFLGQISQGSIILWAVIMLDSEWHYTHFHIRLNIPVTNKVSFYLETENPRQHYLVTRWSVYFSLIGSKSNTTPRPGGLKFCFSLCPLIILLPFPGRLNASMHKITPFKGLSTYTGSNLTLTALQLRHSQV